MKIATEINSITIHRIVMASNETIEDKTGIVMLGEGGCFSGKPADKFTDQKIKLKLYIL